MTSKRVLLLLLPLPQTTAFSQGRLVSSGSRSSSATSPAKAPAPFPFFNFFLFCFCCSLLRFFLFLSLFFLFCCFWQHCQCWGFTQICKPFRVCFSHVRSGNVTSSCVTSSLLSPLWPKWGWGCPEKINPKWELTEKATIQHIYFFAFSSSWWCMCVCVCVCECVWRNFSFKAGKLARIIFSHHIERPALAPTLFLTQTQHQQNKNMKKRSGKGPNFAQLELVLVLIIIINVVLFASVCVL